MRIGDVWLDTPHTVGEYLHQMTANMIAPVSTTLAASLSGLFIALAWLWFWLREDSAHPEPRRLLALAFAGGMAIIPFVIAVELSVQSFVASITSIFIIWAAIEELAKYGIARLAVLWRHEDDEPIDPVIYLVTTALGFAGVENALFLISPISGTTFLETVQNGDMRFAGATLVHVLCSGIVGVFLGASFYSSKIVHALYAFVGIVLAIATHSAFNLLILDATPARMMAVFLLLWILVLVFLAVLEWVKRIRPRQTTITPTP